MLSDSQRERWDFDVMLARDTRDRGREYGGQLVAPSLLAAVDDELRGLRETLALADNLAAAADALLDVTVAGTPDMHMGRIARQIGGLNAAWKAWEKARRAGQPAQDVRE